MKISRLITTDGRQFIPVKKGEFVQKYKAMEGVWEPECSVKHLGGGRYLVGYSSGNYATFDQPLIDKWMILFPSMINIVELK